MLCPVASAQLSAEIWYERKVMSVILRPGIDPLPHQHAVFDVLGFNYPTPVTLQSYIPQ